MREHWKSRAAVPAVAGLLLLLQAALLPAGAVWVTDNGNKFIILENLLRNGSVAIAYPAAEIDPGRRFFPDGNFHFQRHCGRIVSVYPEFFSALALPGYRLFGAVGLWLLPVGGTLAVLALFLALLPKYGPGWKLEAGLAGLLLCGSPLLFYSGTFWEMTAATAFPLAALLAARRRRLLAAGLLLGLGLWLREEFYLIALAAGIAALFFYPKEWRRCVPFGAGFLLAAIPLWIYNLVNYGHILGLHGALYYTHNAEGVPTLAERIGGVFEGFYLYLFRFESGWPGVETGWIPLVPMFLLLAAGAVRSARIKLWAAWIAAAGWAFLFWRFWCNPFPVLASGVTVGFVTSSPLLAGFFLMWRNLLTRGPRPLRMVTLAALLYCLALPVVLTRSDIGLIWGARHYLPVYPLLFVLSFAGFARLGWLRRQRLLTAVLIGATLVLQAVGIRALFGVAEDAARAEATIGALEPRVVVSDLFFLPEMTPRLFFAKQWLYVKNDTELRELTGLLREKGIDRFTLVLSALPGFRQVGDRALAEFLEMAPLSAEPYRLPAPGSGFMTLLIGECRLQ